MDLLHEYNKMLRKPIPKMETEDGITLTVNGKEIGKIVSYEFSERRYPADPWAKAVTIGGERLERGLKVVERTLPPVISPNAIAKFSITNDE